MTQMFATACKIMAGGAAMAAVDVCIVQHGTYWMQVGDNQKQSWLVLGRPVPANEHLERGLRYVRRTYEGGNGSYHATHSLATCAALSHDFVHNGQFQDAYVPAGHGVLMPTLDQEEGDCVYANRLAGGQRDEPVVTTDDIVRQSVCVAEPVMRLWPLPMALVQSRDLAPQSHHGSQSLIARAAHCAGVPHVEDLPVGGLSRHQLVDSARVSRMPTDAFEWHPEV
jgi:hypothetical protein